MSFQSSIFQVVKGLSGQSNIIATPREFCRVMGSLEGGTFLSQLLYWSDKGSADGWFFKSGVEWQDECFLSPYQVKKNGKICIEAGWLETKLKKANGVPTTHYRIDPEKFSEWICTFFDTDCEIFQNGNEDNSEPYNKETKTTTETTAETSTERDKGSSITPEPTKATPKRSLSSIPSTSYQSSNGTTHTVYLADSDDEQTPLINPSNSEALRIYAETFGNAIANGLNDFARKSIVSQLMLDLEKWRKTCEGWALTSFKPDNVRGILDWYIEGKTGYTKPTYGGSKNGTNHNTGNAKPPQKYRRRIPDAIQVAA